METLDPNDFEGDRLRRNGAWGVCFAAEWCPFCRDFLVPFQALDSTEKFRIGLADVSDYDNPLWERFAVEIVPTLVAFRDGRPVWRRDGVAGVGLDQTDLDALCRSLTGRPCSPR